MEEEHAKIFVIAGPSGVGKGTIVKAMAARSPKIWVSISATTRAPRPHEVDGESYFFVTDQEFDRMVATGQMLEWAVVHGNAKYGTPRAPIEEALRAGKVPVLEIDVAGARQVRTSAPEAVQIFIAPPSWEELERRLRGRGTETETQIARRLQTAQSELAAEPEFDIVVVNDTVARATGQILQIMGLEG
ncbi:guanylate kinase [Actinobaculum suis]|uniref:Guanylate kinase n=1 Tax=Actinobaculum suis TaxID=1657 RepID=A0A1B9BBD6_9ACTO|nr:guanylate kinase [Actinobaculum suis]MDY5153135.1 guanylate kinase [Actinobaculum suis]OCA93780.1 guanylate kinase [Actinobaculum suis]OCA94073.1 guanylate kinase [Actinobaculum suis]SDE33465.1 guanylate kinase [Actinobaculum suis]VDG76437.1 guanylate kinase [Actinobaculum suis]